MIELSKQTEELISEQLSSWELARNNYAQLGRVRIKELSFDGFSVFVQFNPERIRSSAAKVDAKSIGERPCFLCAANRPPEQKGIAVDNNMVILINPFPIFPRHLTIPSLGHTDQLIRGRFGQMLDLAISLPGYVVFYNGPQCGASAPDHFHFQAGNSGFMPIESDFAAGSKLYLLRDDGVIKIWKWRSYLRGILTISGSDKSSLERAFGEFYDSFSALQPDKTEPMLNILAGFSGGEWIIHLIPRKQHRPVQYFAEGEKKIIVSPASVDLGGVFIVPREEDFERLDKELIVDILDQVCYNENEVEQMIKN